MRSKSSTSHSAIFQIIFAYQLAGNESSVHINDMIAVIRDMAPVVHDHSILFTTMKNKSGPCLTSRLSPFNPLC